MSAFKDMVAADNKDVFLNMDEFGEKHNLNGADCQCILQNSAAVQALSKGRTVAADKFCCRMYDNICTMLDRTDQIRGTKSIVY